MSKRVLYIPHYEWYKMYKWATEKPSLEVGGVLNVKLHPNGFEVEEASLLKQEVSSGRMTLDDAEVDKWRQAQFPDTYMKVPRPQLLEGRWHSHHGMGAFWSPTDEATMVTSNLTWGPLINLVVTTKNEAKARLDLLVGGTSRKDALHINQDLDIVISPVTYGKEIDDALQAEYKANVTEAVTTIPTKTWRGIIGDDEEWPYSMIPSTYKRYVPKEIEIDTPPEDVRCSASGRSVKWLGKGKGFLIKTGEHVTAFKDNKAGRKAVTKILGYFPTTWESSNKPDVEVTNSFITVKTDKGIRTFTNTPNARQEIEKEFGIKLPN